MGDAGESGLFRCNFFSGILIQGKPFAVFPSSYAVMAAAILLVACLSGCLGPVTELYPEDVEERPIPVYIVQVGWHAGLVVESGHLGDAFPDHEMMPEAEYLKIGWGDDKYYPDPDPSFWLLLRATFWPSRSVLHVVGMDMPASDYFAGSDVVTLHLSAEGIEKLTGFVSRYFRRDDDGKPIYHTRGRYGNSAFFKARSRYYFPKTSNVWTARALRSAGVPITPVYAITARNVMRQAKKAARKDEVPETAEMR
ncbi:MAG: DUF2459 domain-containing protein [Cyclonatronaceae bacterium]